MTYVGVPIGVAVRSVRACRVFPEGTAQVGTSQVGIAQVGIDQEGTSQVGLEQEGLAQVGTPQLGIAQVGIEQTNNWVTLTLTVIRFAPCKNCSNSPF